MDTNKMEQSDRYYWSVTETWTKMAAPEGLPKLDGYDSTIKSAYKAAHNAVIRYLHPILHGESGELLGKQYYNQVVRSPVYSKHESLTSADVGEILVAVPRTCRGKLAWECHILHVSDHLSFKVSVKDTQPPYLKT